MSLLQLVYYICGNASTTLVPNLSSQLLPSLWQNGNFSFYNYEGMILDYFLMN